MRGILSIFVQYFRVQRIHHETRRKINLRSDELNGGPFSRRLIFCWIDIINSIYSLNSCWEIRIDPFKSIAQLGHLPKHSDDSSKAWLYGKLFAALLTNKLIEYASSISPWGYMLEEQSTSERMAWIQFCLQSGEACYWAAGVHQRIHLSTSKNAIRFIIILDLNGSIRISQHEFN